MASNPITARCKAFVVLTAAAAGLFLSAPVSASIDGDVKTLQAGMKRNIHNMELYDTFVAAMEREHLLPSKSQDAFMGFMTKIMDENLQFQGFKMMGLALYGRGYAEESYNCAQVFEKRAMSVGQAIGKVNRIVDGMDKSGLTPLQAGVLKDTNAALKGQKPANDKPNPLYEQKLDNAMLHNGQSMRGKVGEKTADGVWFHSDGAKIFLKTDEIAFIKEND